MPDEDSLDPSVEFEADPTLVVIASVTSTASSPADAASADAPSAGGTQPSDNSFSSLTAFVADAGAQLVRAFAGDTAIAPPETPPGAPESAGANSAHTLAEALKNLLRVFYIQAPLQALEDLASKLLLRDDVEAAYVKPPSYPPQWSSAAPAATDDPPASTTDFSPRQGYLDPAPGGVDARYAWTVKGGTGTGVQIIDIEGEWRLSHEDLAQNLGGLAGGTPPNSSHWRNHGTAVIGVFSGDSNGFGIEGICPDATVRTYSIFPVNKVGSAAAIVNATKLLNAGDIMLIELHRAGPTVNYAESNSQAGYIAIEWWPDDYFAISYAVAKGIIVVEAAGNGNTDLDDPIFDTQPAFVKGAWANPFKRQTRDSGAIIVGAGSPPPGIHGKTIDTDRARLSFSNYGSAVDAQGWGREVTTTGYGDLQGGSNEDVWYTDTFNGTSSASPVVVGVLGCLQGVRRGAGLRPLWPSEARDCLRSTGSPQQDGTSGTTAQRIGNRPDLKQLITKVLSTIFNGDDGITSNPGDGVPT